MTASQESLKKQMPDLKQATSDYFAINHKKMIGKKNSKSALSARRMDFYFAIKNHRAPSNTERVRWFFYSSSNG
jgi:hypothetical protein